MPGRILRSERESNKSNQHSSPIPGMDHFKRHSIAGFGKNKDKAEKIDGKSVGSQSPGLKPVKHQNAISLAMESPPAIFIGPATSSTGALISGQIRINVVTAPEIVLESFKMSLVTRSTARRPVSKDCPDCSVQSYDLHDWNFLSEPKTLKTGEHSFPFSHLIPGHLPVTTIGDLAKLEYGLRAKAKTRTGEELSLWRPLDISRAITADSMQERNSIRIFPPTNLTVNLTFKPVMYPIGRFNFLMKIDGVTHKDGDIQHRWRLRKMNWRLEEKEKMVMPACKKHSAKVGGEGKGIAHEDVRHIGHAELREGWKTNFDTGEIEMEFSCSTSGNPRALCDVEAGNGLSVAHTLVVELVVAEEWAQLKKPNSATPTGTARVLRAQFTIVMTERSGMGISWDEEQPPMYEDVPPSPPLYPKDSQPTSSTAPPSYPTVAEIVDYEGPPLEHIPGLSLEVRRPNSADRRTSS